MKTFAPELPSSNIQFMHQNKKNRYVVIMAGGIGSRFWPFSRQHYPKQFQDILGTGKTLIQETVSRFEDICPKENIFIVTNERYDELIKEQLPELGEEQILKEPFQRNTAPCIAYAAYKIRKRNPDAVMIVTPADHIILQPQSFKEKIVVALESSESSGRMITLGIRPTRPDTGYGYIQIKSGYEGMEVKKVKTFTEKPNKELAEAFIESGDFVWNAGIFIWSVTTVTAAFEKYQSQIAEAFIDIEDDFYTPREEKSLYKAYSQCHKISIDYAIMEKADNVFVVPCNCGWSDLGTWKSLYEHSSKDENDNVISGTVKAYETEHCIIKTPEDRLVVVQGLQNFIIAEYDNVLVICEKDQEQRIKKFLEESKKEFGDLYS